MEHKVDEPSKPTPKKDIDCSKLIVMCESYINDLGTDNHRDDNAHYVYEVAMETVYGKEVWEYINGKLG